MSSDIDIRDQVQGVEKELSAELALAKEEPTPTRVEQFRLAFLGRKGKIPALLEQLRHCPKDDRPEAGRLINTLKKTAETEVTALKSQADQWVIAQKLKGSPIDISLPATRRRTGSLHPVNLMRRTLIREFHRLGFTIFDGPEVDFEFYNFNALNMPESHPARDMQDTFYIKGRGGLVMRTHTSNIQIHAMLQERPPIRAVAMGRTYRCDYDPTHTPMFHQIEGFIVDREISFAHLKGVIDSFLKAVYGNDLKTRFRPSFFPFVEPGAEMDLQCVQCRGKGCRLCKSTGWLEIGGCGMIHPNVFENVEYDSEEYTGFAFGFGLDRMALLKYSLEDLRHLFEGDSAFLSQFALTP